MRTSESILLALYLIPVWPGWHKRISVLPKAFCEWKEVEKRGCLEFQYPCICRRLAGSHFRRFWDVKQDPG